MKTCIEDGKAVEIDARRLVEGDEVVFPCGCRFPINRGMPDVLGVHPSFAYEPERVPLDCPATWGLIGSGRTKGVFQLESSLGRHWAKRLKPRSMEHLSALVSLLRPGVLKAKDERGVSMTELYCRRKNGEEDFEQGIPAIAHIMGSTFGIMCFQEQMMQIAQMVAGFDLVQVDQLRKAAGKKDQTLMAEMGVIFVEQATELGVITREQAVALFENIRKSGRYSFNRSHSLAYAINSYRSAHAKAHLPLYFFTSYLLWAKEKSKPLKEMRELINDAKAFDIAVIPPRFVEVREHFGSDGTNVCFGLADIKDVGEASVRKIAAAMPAAEAEIGPRLTWSWYDFLTRFSHVAGKVSVRKMIEVGALRDIDPRRQRLIDEHDAWTRLTEKEQESILGLGEPIYRMIKVTEEVEEEVPKYAPKEMKAYRAAVAEWEQGGGVGEAPGHPKPTKTVVVRKRVPTGEEVVEEIDGEPVVIDPARPVSCIQDAIAALLLRVVGHTKGSKSSPSHPVYAFKADRREKIEAILGMLRNPPMAAQDMPYWIAKVEEESLGLPITVSHTDSADRSLVNCTVRQYLDGWEPRSRDDLIILGVEVQELNERVVANGNNVGRKMARLTVEDGTGVLDQVVCFPDSWEKNAMMLHRPGTIVALGGRRDYKDGVSFFVDRVWEI